MPHRLQSRSCSIPFIHEFINNLMSITYRGSRLFMDVARYFRIYLLSCIAILGHDKGLGRSEDKAWNRRGIEVETYWRNTI